jgi:hypothetical protein
MCLTGADIRSEEESLVWDILCQECSDKAERLLGERRALRLFDIPMEDYAFCQECVRMINELLDEVSEGVDEKKDFEDGKFCRSKT